MKINKEIIQKKIIKKDGSYNTAILKNLIIPEEYNWCDSKIEYIEAILFEIKNKPLCLQCDKEIKYNRKLKIKPKYSKFCSNNCKQKYNFKDTVLTKDYIESNLIRSDGNYNIQKIKVIKIPNEYNWCKLKVEYLDCIRYNIKEPPKCRYCNKPTKYNVSSKKQIKYQEFCSIPCVNKYSETKKKILKTNNEKYGKNYYTQTKEYIEKTKNNNIKKYGFSSTNKKHIQNILEFENLNSKLLKKWIDKDELFLIQEFMDYFNVTRKTVNDLKTKFKIQNPNKQNKSKTQKEIFILIKNEIDKVFYNNQGIIKTKNKKLELDIFVPEFNFAIEYNELTYHSYGYSEKYTVLNNYKKEKKIFSFNDDNELSKNFYNKDKHLLKTELSEKKNIQLFHIFENEWLNLNKRKIWISMIYSKMNKNNRIFARKCTIKEISSKDAKLFCETNHIQGYINSSIKIGLFYNEELVSVMTFGKSRRNKWKGKDQYELYRFCSKLNTTIVGGASKLLKYFELNYNPKLLISYANRRWSTGNLYEKLDFELVDKTIPNFFYFKLKDLKYDFFELESREKYQKYRLKEYFEKGKIEFFNEDIPTELNMFINDYRRIWDSGNLVYIKKYI